MILPLTLHLVLISAVVVEPPAPADDPPLVTRAAVKAAIDRGANWIIDHQREDGAYGSYQGDAGITALALAALAGCPRAYREEDGPFISKGVEYLLANRHPDGAIYNEGQGLRNYKTSMSILALTALDRGRSEPRYREVVSAAREFVSGLQCSEGSKPAPYDREVNRRAYGGIGYGSDRRPDLSNTQLALEALAASGMVEDSEVWARARIFIGRCQNRAESNDFLDGKEHRSTEDGGFFYYPGESKAENVKNPDGSTSYSSYGGMTYAGVKSFIHAGLTRDDPRVKSALEWIRGHYTVDENPGMATPENPERGQMGVYYYYGVMARALELVGEPVIVDHKGQKHRWAADLARKLISLQQGDGSWVNRVDRWWEGDPTVTTAYAVSTLSIWFRSLKE
ncbi:MAG: prenyltransferase/squalene oxidase repeat-containing protein [Planctomycetota bacterium]